MGTDAMPRSLFFLSSYGKKASGIAIAGNVAAIVIATTIARTSRALRLFLMNFTPFRLALKRPRNVDISIIRGEFLPVSYQN